MFVKILHQRLLHSYANFVNDLANNLLFVFLEVLGDDGQNQCGQGQGISAADSARQGKSWQRSGNGEEMILKPLSLSLLSLYLLDKGPCFFSSLSKLESL